MVSSVRVKVTRVTDASLHHSSSATAAAVKMQKHHHQPRINLSMKIPTFPPPIHTIIFIIDWTILVAWTVSTIIEYHQGIIRAYLIGLIYSQLIWCKCNVVNVVMWLLRNAGWQRQHDPMVMRPPSPSPVSWSPPTLQLRSWYAPCYVLLLSIIHIQTAS